MGQWTVYRRVDGGRADVMEDLTVDQAFGRMMEMTRTRWMVAARPGGGYRLDLTRLGPVPDLPYADAETVTEFWPCVESDSEDQRTAERDMKEGMLYRGRDGVESFYMPIVGGSDPVTARYVERLAKRGARLAPMEDDPKRLN